MRTARVVIPGEPVAKGRPRVDTRGRFPRIHSPQTTIEATKQAAKWLVAGLRGAPLKGPVVVELRFTFPVRPSWTKAKQRARMGAWHTDKPDKDNLEKLLLDAANGLLWADDAAVCVGLSTKVWGSEGSTEVLAYEAGHLRGRPVILWPDEGDQLALEYGAPQGL